MRIEIKVPQLPESVSDATLVAWHKKAGETVSRDENLVDLETDKVVLEVPAPASGTLQEIKIADGTTVTSGEVLAILLEGEGIAAQAAAKASPEGGVESVPVAAETPAAQSAESAHKLSPSVRRLLDEPSVEHPRCRSCTPGATGPGATGAPDFDTAPEFSRPLASFAEPFCFCVGALRSSALARASNRAVNRRLSIISKSPLWAPSRPSI